MRNTHNIHPESLKDVQRTFLSVKLSRFLSLHYIYIVYLINVQKITLRNWKYFPCISFSTALIVSRVIVILQ